MTPARRAIAPRLAGAALLAVLAPLSVPAPAHAAPPVDPAAMTAGLPDGRAVLERAVEAMGGQEAFDAITSVAVDLVMTVPTGEMRVEALAGEADQLSVRFTVELQSPVQARMVKNGDVAWATMQPLDDELEPIGEPQLMPQAPSRELRQFGFAVRAHWMVLRMLEDYETIRTVEITQFEDQAALRVRVSDPRTDRAREQAPGDRFLYVSLADGLPLGIDAPVEGEGEPRQILAFKDVREFGDLRLFTRMTGSRGTARQSFVFESIDFNVVPAAAFAVPEEVRRREAARREAQAAAGGAGDGDTGAAGG